MKSGFLIFRWVPCTLFVLAIALPGISAGSETVLPGAVDRMVAVDRACPTFRWESTPNEDASELVVYAIDPELYWTDYDLTNEPPELSVRLPRGVSSWTPSGDECLDSSKQYVWFVRALFVDDEGQLLKAENWSAARYFEIDVASPVSFEEGIRGENADGSDSSLPPVQSKGVNIGSPSAIRGLNMEQDGESFGVIGVVLSPDGAGLLAVNVADGPDIALHATGSGTDTLIRESGIDRPSPVDQSFDVTNSGAGAMHLRVEGVEVVTAATDQDTLGSLSCAQGQVALWNGAAWICHDETPQPASLFSFFGGDGSNGSWTVNFDTFMNSHRKQFTDFTVSAGSTYSVRPTRHGAGYIAVQNRCTIAGVISADGKGNIGAIAQTTVGSGNPASNAVGTRASSWAVPYAATGAGGAGGRGGPMSCGGDGGGADAYGGYGCSSGDAGVGSQYIRVSGGTLNSGDGTTTTSGFASLLNAVGGGGGSGGLNTSGGTGGRGGDGGGIIYLECGELDFSGAIYARGNDGEDGIGDAGGGGGGGGGVVLIRTRKIVSATGVISAAGGVGGLGAGTGNDGGLGADGFWDLVVVP